MQFFVPDMLQKSSSIIRLNLIFERVLFFLTGNSLAQPFLQPLLLALPEETRSEFSKLLGPLTSYEASGMAGDIDVNVLALNPPPSLVEEPQPQSSAANFDFALATDFETEYFSCNINKTMDAKRGVLVTFCFFFICFLCFCCIFFFFGAAFCYLFCFYAVGFEFGYERNSNGR